MRSTPVSPFSVLDKQPTEGMPQFMATAEAAPMVVRRAPIQISFQELKPFQPVDHSYQRVGVQFEGAIAIQPSNPAFGMKPGQLGLIPMSGNPSISARFRSPQQQVKVHLSGARQVRVVAYDPQDQVVLQQIAGHRSYVGSAPQDGIVFPQHEMTLASDRGIAKVTIASDAPFVMAEMVCH